MLEIKTQNKPNTVLFDHNILNKGERKAKELVYLT